MEIIKKKRGAPVGLFHIDVEGYEISVMRGGKKMILRDNPVISFEQHINLENVNIVCGYLKSLEYRVYMINEIVQCNALDCRNFLAFPIKKGLPTLEYFDQSTGRNLGIYSSMVGPTLIEV